MAGTAVLHGILEDYVPLLIDAVEQPEEVTAIVHTNQHSPEQQLPEFGNSWGAAASSISRCTGAVAIIIFRNWDSLR